MTADRAAPIPALMRVGDIGVATEWRSLVLDWTSLLTDLGADIYTYLRDDYDHQRNLWPFLVPQGPTKRKVQTKLGRKSAVSLAGPEYLLAAVGLVSISYVRGAADPEHPNRTHVAYYSVGKLDYPQLDWPMLSHVLDALIVALDPPDERQRQAAKALKALALSGMFQNADPADVFYDFGAWPQLLPQLIDDPRWERLFASLHGPAALISYRRAARAWCAAVERTMRRRDEQNQAIMDAVQAMQAQHGNGPAAPAAPSTPPLPPVVPPSPAAGTSGAPGTQPGDLRSAGTQPGDLRSAASVPGESLASPQPADLGSAASGTSGAESQSAARSDRAERVPIESPAADRYTLINCRRGENEDSSDNVHADSGDSEDESDADSGDISRHLREDELGSSRLDARFWCTVNTIVSGSSERYPCTPGERKALQRRFQQQDIPTGVVLAALRALAAAADPPRTLAAALAAPAFQRYINQALALAPRANTGDDQWTQFLFAYRSAGTANLRQVSPDEHRCLRSLFQQHPEECWAVLRRIEQMADPPARLSARYVEQAVRNNRQAAIQHDLAVPRPDCGVRPGAPASEDDALAARLRELQLRPADVRLYAPELVQAWLAEYGRRAASIERPRHWLLWGLKSGLMPQDHPDLKRHAAPMRSAEGPPPRRDPAPVQPPLQASPSQATPSRWQQALHTIERQLPANEFATWIQPALLVDYLPDQAVVATSHVFGRDKLQSEYRQLIAEALGVQHVEFVIDHGGG